MPKTIAVLGYILILMGLAAVIVIRGGSKNVALVAQRELGANSVVLPGDFWLKTDGRQLVTRKVVKGGEISADEIEDAATYTTQKNTVPFSVSVDRKDFDIGKFVVGRNLTLCPVKIIAKARALHCAHDGHNCIAVVDVSSTNSGKLEKDSNVTLSSNDAC